MEFILVPLGSGGGPMSDFAAGLSFIKPPSLRGAP